MTPERRAELAGLAVAAAGGDVRVPAADVLGMLGQLELLRQRGRLDDRAAKLAGRIEQLAPYIARATKAIEDGRGVLRELLRLDSELALEDAPHAAMAERQYRELVDELEGQDR